MIALAETDPLLETEVELADALFEPEEPQEEEPGDDEHYAEEETDDDADDHASSAWGIACSRGEAAARRVEI